MAAAASSIRTTPIAHSFRWLVARCAIVPNNILIVFCSVGWANGCSGDSSRQQAATMKRNPIKNKLELFRRGRDGVRQMDFMRKHFEFNKTLLKLNNNNDSYLVCVCRVLVRERRTMPARDFPSPGIRIYLSLRTWRLHCSDASVTTKYTHFKVWTHLKTYKHRAVLSILVDMWPKYHTKSTTMNSNGICACASSAVASIHCCCFDDLILMHCKWIH